jgi:hypothetical protein
MLRNALLLVSFTLGVSSFVYATHWDGGSACYVPIRGEATTIHRDDLNTNSQDGRYELTLKRTGKSTWRRAPPRLKLKGLMRGAVTSADPETGTIYLNHTLWDARGKLHTQEDYAAPAGLPEYDMATGCVRLPITETMHIVGGTGFFSGAQGTLEIVGSLFIAPQEDPTAAPIPCFDDEGDPVPNTFKVLGWTGKLCFERPTNECSTLDPK